MKAIPLVVNRVLNKAGLRDQAAGRQSWDGTYVYAFGPRVEKGEARDVLTTAEKALKDAGYAVEWHVEEGVNNSFLIVREA